MTKYFLHLYDRLVLKHPVVSLLFCLALTGYFISWIPQFKLDASSDSLVLEDDDDLRFYRSIVDRYGSEEVLIITYSPTKDLFSSESLSDLAKIRNELRVVDGVASVTTLLDVPLLYSSKVEIGDLSEPGSIKTLEDGGLELSDVKEELLESPLYRNRLLSDDGQTATILVNLPVDEKYKGLLKRRYQLREKEYDQTITETEKQELQELLHEFDLYTANINVKQDKLVGDIRVVMNKYRARASLYLAGVPMIISDMISFIRSDLTIFGIGVFLFLLITLAVIFRRVRWVVLTLICCASAGLVMIGYLGLVDWRVTVISSNFISLMLIFTMSLIIHLIVRYREVLVAKPELDQRGLILETVRLKFIPCLYTTMTTIVAFVSLLVSGIRPVIDFGLMMTIGLAVSFTLSFVLFPAGAMLMSKEATPKAKKKEAKPFTLLFARLTAEHGNKIVIVSIILALISGYGISKLKVENRFIDYFRSSTEIYQGMKLVDQKLGGTTPLELIISYKTEEEPEVAQEESLVDEEVLEDDDLLFDYSDTEDEKQPWYVSAYKMGEIEKIHDFLTKQPEVGEVLSIATAMKIATKLNKDITLDNYEIALVHEKSPDDIREMLLDPYLNESPAQARITMRVKETDESLQRLVFLDKITKFLTEDMGLAADQVRFTGMFVLYNNMLQSLYTSQIETIGMVFLGILLMFLILFRSISISLIAIIPNLLPAAMVLGALGLFGIPLDMMTITIAAITIGIAVDDTIHYIHRFKKEFLKDRDYNAALFRCHASIGRAMLYTSVTIVIGFSILVMSNFIPSVYFGIFTGFAMLMALLAALTLLPRLLIIWKPFGK
ncbi:MAG: MMPL family transporter [Desulfobulbaceae bacterium]|nr:MMPL family transporter [Desulfobulbaceae bacterium]